MREFFKDKFAFQHTGLEKGDMAKQLSAFRDSLEDCGMAGCAMPNVWMEAFRMLRDLVAQSSGMSLEDLLSRLNAEKGGRWIRRLEELEPCGFVRRHGRARGMTVRSHVLSFLFIETADDLMAFLV